MSSYNYSIVDDFKNATVVNLTQLTSIIDTNNIINVVCEYINLDDDIISIHFVSALSNDELAELNNIVSIYTYTAPHMDPISIARGAIISKSTLYPGDYNSIAAAFNSGEKSVFVKNGTYYETSDIIMGAFCDLTGETTGGVIIVLLNGSSIKCDGSNGLIETVGTISCTHNTNIINGVGTTFTNLKIGDYILLGNNYYRITTITSNTVLTISIIYKGDSINNLSYYASTANSGVTIRDVLIISPPGHNADYGIYLRSVFHSVLMNVVIGGKTTNICYTNCSNISTINLIAYDSYSNGISIINSTALLFTTIGALSNIGNGINIDNSNNIIIEMCRTPANFDNGIRITNSQKIKINSCFILYNKNNGIHITSSDNITINSNNILYNGNYGIISNINSIITDNNINYNNSGISAGLSNIISSNQLSNNTLYAIYVPINQNTCNITNNNIALCTNGISIDANGCIVSNNIITSASSNGIVVNASDSNVSGNYVKSGLESGIYLSSNAIDSIISTNRCSLNTDNGILTNIASTGNMITNNICKNNTGTGIVDNSITNIVSANIV